MSLRCELAIPLSDLTYADLSTGVDVAGRAASADIGGHSYRRLLGLE